MDVLHESSFWHIFLGRLECCILLQICVAILYLPFNSDSVLVLRTVLRLRMRKRYCGLRIRHYLQGTKDKGLIFRHNKAKFAVDCYVDADFEEVKKDK